MMFQRQLRAERAKHAAYEEKIDRLTMRVDQLMAGRPAETKHEPAPAAPPTTVNNITNNNVGTINIVNQIHLHPWGGPKTLRVPGEMITAAFTENPRLAEYCSLSEADKYDEEKSKGYILEALMELTKRAHADPVQRNVYLNPNRADQAMICADAVTWEACPLYEATKMMFESVSAEVHAAIPLVPAKGAYVIPMEIQGSACYVPTMYRSNPKQYIDGAKAQIVAHLANLASAKRRAS
jgi:hypothetical protein